MQNNSDKIGVLIVNLGTPENPDVPSIRKFLRQFLSDPRVVEIPRPVWLIILHAFILPFRPAKLVHSYQSIWTKNGAPLMVFAESQQKKLSEYFAQSDDSSEKYEFVTAMSYGQPSIKSGLQQLQQKGIYKVLILPMYAQYSCSTTAAVFDAVSKELRTMRRIPECRFINTFFDNETYIKGLAETVKQHWQKHTPAEKLIMSFHGVPQSYVDKGDPYYDECVATANLLAKELDLTEQQWQITFQSRFGKAEWIKPYTSATLEQLAKQGTESVDIICPGFSNDCLETLEEIEVENRDVFFNAGGKEFRYIPALNDSQEQIELLADLVRSHTQGW